MSQTQTPLEAVGLENPFPGLRPFREDEEHLFFGRESQVDRMVDKLAATRFLAVVGTSGSGKSSLVNCGLKPALHRGLMSGRGTSWRIVTFRPGGSPVRSMARAFVAEEGFFAHYQPEGLSLLEIVEATLSMSSLGLADLFEYARFDPGTNLLVVADQFEELFRYGKAGSCDVYGVSDEAVAFVNLLLEAHAHPEFPIYIVLTMRSDFLGECSQFDGLPEVINEGQYLVPRLTREERRAATAGPVGVVGGQLNPVLLTRLVNDVGDNPDQLSILQHAVNRTWSWWQTKGHGEGALSLEHYEAVGAMARALDSHAEEAFGELTTGRQQKICERVFKALTDKGTDARGIRRPMSLKKLCDVVGATQEDVVTVLDVFRVPSRSFLMPPVAELLEPDTVIDISHEILMRVWERLKKWADEEAQSASTYRRLAESAELHAKGEESLWRDPGLQVALEWRWKQMPNAAWATLYREGFEQALAFLDASKQVRDVEKAEAEFARRWRKATPFLGALVFVIFLALSVKLSESLAPWVQQHLEKFLKPAVANEIKDLNPGVPNLSSGAIGKGNLAEAFAYVFCGSISALISILLYAILSFAGKHIYRRVSFAGIAQRVSASPAGLKAQAATASSATGSRETAKGEPILADYWRRLIAAALDGVICLFLPMFIMVMIVIVEAAISVEVSDTATGVTVFILIPIVAYVYQVLMARFTPWGGTLGVLASRIAIRKRNGERPGFGRMTARFAASVTCFYSLAIALIWTGMLITKQVDKDKTLRGVPFLIVGAGVFLQFVTPRRQALYDLIAGTIVVRRVRPTHTVFAAEE